LNNKYILCWNHSKNDFEKIFINDVADLTSLYGLNHQIEVIQKKYYLIINPFTPVGGGQ